MGRVQKQSHMSQVTRTLGAESISRERKDFKVGVGGEVGWKKRWGSSFVGDPEDQDPYQAQVEGREGAQVCPAPTTVPWPSVAPCSVETRPQ